MDVIVTRYGREARLDWGAGVRRAAIGRSGIGGKEREGDGLTPLGTFALRRVFYRPDRMIAPRTALPTAALTPEDGWCDAPQDARYNTLIKRPYPAGSETLWRDDPLYDLIVVLGFNDDPVVPGEGSAIFLHVARTDYGPTEGCIALAANDLLELLGQVKPGDTITIKA